MMKLGLALGMGLNFGPADQAGKCPAIPTNMSDFEVKSALEVKS